jgi:uncharacterized protein (DUF433 family)
VLGHHDRVEAMTIKWVKSDPLVMNGEPFCYGSRLTVRQLLQLRQSGYSVTEILKDHPELRAVGIAFAYRFAAEDERYREFLAPDGWLAGPGFTAEEAMALPDDLRIPGVVVQTDAAVR